MRYALTLTAATLAAVFATGPLAAQTGLTIYQDGRVLVRRTVDATVPAGASRHRLALGELDPGSLFPLDTALRITRARYDAAVDEDNTMRRAVGTVLPFVRHLEGRADTVRATVLGVMPERFRLADGAVTFQRPGVPVYPAALVLVETTVELDLLAPARRHALALGWFTGGANWNAAYQVVLGRRGVARVTGHAVIPSFGITVDSAEVQLVAGSIRRAAPPMPMMDAAEPRFRMAAEQAAASAPEAVGEAQLYTLPGRVTLRPGVTTSAMLFEPVGAAVEKTYTVPGELPWRGFLQQNPEEQTVPVEVTWVVARGARTDFGGRPLPGGAARLYEEDAQGRPQLVGEAAFGHTAAGQDLRLTAAHAFDLTARRTQTTYTTQREGNRTHAFAEYRVTVANAKDSAVTVDVLERRSGDWQVLQSSVPAERLSSSEARFRLRVPAGGETVLTYRVRVSW